MRRSSDGLRIFIGILADGLRDVSMPQYDIIQEFITRHGGEDPMRLLLSRSKWPEVDMDAVVGTIEGRRRMEKKVPSWTTGGLIYPSTLCTEQCSSEVTALLKASIALRIADEGFRIADLTGGAGVDSWAFSLKAKEVLHNEADSKLSDSVQYNFSKLGRENVLFSSYMVVPDNVPEEGNSRHIRSLLEDFRPDIIFLDPARRSSSGKKVFLLEDCSPDVIPLMPSLLGQSPEVLMKLSPMADIPMVVSRLGKGVREVHVIGHEGECKELLIRISRGYEGEAALFVHEGGEEISLPISAEKECVPSFLDSEASIEGLAREEASLFIPGKAISKAGLFNWMSSHWGIAKAAPSAHLYFIRGKDSRSEESPMMGRALRIIRVLPLSSSNIKAIGKEFPKADVLAKDIPLSSEELAKKTGVSSGGEFMIVGCPVHCSQNPCGKDGRWLFVCRKTGK